MVPVEAFVIAENPESADASTTHRLSAIAGLAIVLLAVPDAA